MSGTWVPLLAQLVAPALVVAWSPFKIVPALLLVLHSTRPIATAVAFLATSLAGLAAVTALFIRMPHALDHIDRAPRTWGPWAPLALAVGAAMLVLSALLWSRRHRPGRAPGWLSRFTRVTPLGAVILGVVLALSNPKVLAMNAIAGVAIGAAGASLAGAAAAVALYTVVAGSTLIVPIVGYALAAERVDQWLVWLRLRMRRHQNVLASALIALMGITLLVVGVRAV